MAAKQASIRQSTVNNTKAPDQSIEGFGDFMKELSYPFWLSMVMGGFVGPYSNQKLTSIWQGLFMFSMILCGSLCIRNCFVRVPPFHMFPADLMVGLVHIPGLYSLSFWRGRFNDPLSDLWVLLGHSV